MIKLASKEVISYGLILAASGISQLVRAPSIYGPLSLIIEYAGFLTVAIGVFVCALGLAWRWGPWERPLGITLLAIGFIFTGLVSLVLGGWIFTPLFLLALVSFAMAWGLLTAKNLAKSIAELLTVLGLLASVLGIGSDGIVSVPGILGALYIVWYLERPHVTKYFGSHPSINDLSKRTLLFFLLILAVLPPALLYLYISPLTRVITGNSGGGGGGSSGSWYIFSRGDTLVYSYQVDAGYGPITLTIERTDAPHVIIASSYGTSGTGTALVDVPGQYTVWVNTESGFFNMHYEITVTMASIRTALTQWALLDLYLIVIVSCLIMRKKRKTAPSTLPPQTSPSVQS